MLSHLEAKNILLSVDPTLSLPERMVAQAVSLHESSYGAGWKPGHGEGSHNWGAIMRPSSDSGPFFETQDSNPAGPFVGHFKVYPTDEDGALDVVHVALKPNVRAAAQKGDVRAVAQAMFDNKYYTGTSTVAAVNVARYAQALSDAVTKIIAETGEKNPFPKALPAVPASSPSPQPSSSASLPVLQMGSVGPAVSLLRSVLAKVEPSAMIAPGDRFDAVLETGVKLLQGAAGIKNDGIVGPQTWLALASRLAEPLPVGFGAR